MKFAINQSELANALSVVHKGVAQRSTLPILSGIYISARGNGVQFQTTNLEMSVQYNCSAMVEEEGATVLPGRIIVEIVKNLPDAAVHIEVNDQVAVISCEATSFSIKALDPADFPGFPQVSPEQQIQVPFESFSTMARKVSRVVSKDESRMILTGVLITVEEGALKLVATDSYRLAVAEQPFTADSGSAEFSAVLSGAFMADLASLPKTAENITLALANNQIIVTYGETVFVNRRIEGNFPNYKQLLPTSFDTRCTVNRAGFNAAVKRVSLLDAKDTHVRFSINEPSNTIQLSSSQEVGSIQEIINAQIEGQDVEISFTSGLFTEGLSVIDSADIYFELQGAMKPCILRSTDEAERFLYLVMPVRS